MIEGVEEFSHIRNGDILIAHATSPAWTPLFSRLSGIIVENASLLSHAVIVAREAGIPSVINIANATQTFEDGELLEIDGGTGEVTRSS